MLHRLATTGATGSAALQPLATTDCISDVHRAQQLMPRMRLKSGDDLEFVDWINEPRHKLLFENKHTRVYQTLFGPVGTAHATLFHRHTMDTVYACINDTGPGGEALNQEVEDGVLLEPRPVQAHTGLCFCRMSGPEPYIHRVSVSAKNTEEILFVGAEVLEAAGPRSDNRLAGVACYGLEAEHPRFRVWRLVLNPEVGQSASTGRHRWHFSGVVIMLTDAQHLTASESSPFRHQTAESLAKGAAFWFDGPVEQELSLAVGSERFEALVVEWR